jgi:hypothetical protein
MTKPAITTRVANGAALTYSELDTNFTNLRDATISVTDTINTHAFNLNDTIEFENATVNASTGKITITPGGYTLPIASTIVLGGVKIDNTTITINAVTGQISVTGDDLNHIKTSSYIQTTAGNILVDNGYAQLKTNQGIGSGAYTAALISLTNLGVSVTNKTKWVGVGGAGEFQIVDNAQNTIIFSLSDAGLLQLPTATKTGSSTGIAGQICWDANYIYVCTAINTWKRATLSTF